MNVRHRKNVERCRGDDASRLLLLSAAVKDKDTLEGEFDTKDPKMIGLVNCMVS